MHLSKHWAERWRNFWSSAQRNTHPRNRWKAFPVWPVRSGWLKKSLSAPKYRLVLHFSIFRQARSRKPKKNDQTDAGFENNAKWPSVLRNQPQRSWCLATHKKPPGRNPRRWRRVQRKDVWTSRFREMSSADRQFQVLTPTIFLPEAPSAQCRKVQSWSWPTMVLQSLH